MEARRDMAITASLIASIVRDFTPEFAMSTLMTALPYKDWLIGIGLDSDDRKGPPGNFAGVFARARQEGFQVPVHCDIDQPHIVDDIRTALMDIRADRIDHGTDIIRSDALTQEAVDRKIGFTVCPISNRACTGDTQADEIGRLIKRGAVLTVKSDDPAYFKAYINDNYAVLARELGLGAGEIAQLAQNSFDAAWISDHQRTGFHEAVDDYRTGWLRDSGGRTR